MNDYKEFLKACVFYGIPENKAKYYWFVCNRRMCYEILDHYRKEAIQCTR